MRNRRLALLVASFGALAVVAAGCNDQPNRDLNDYSAPATAKTANSENTGQHQQHRADGAKHGATASSSVRRIGDASKDVALTTADVRSEGVAPSRSDGSGPPECLGVGARKAVATWRYPTGSLLEQYVLPGKLAAKRCGEPIAVAPQAGVAKQRAWCAGTNCALAMERDGLLSVLRVDAKQRKQAAEAIQRLAPAMSGRLSQH